MKYIYRAGTQLRVWAFVAASLLASCRREAPAMFELLSPERTGIHFANTITENDTLNILKFEYVYNGAGVSVGDFNNDSLPDLYFTGNQVSNRLYLNRGDFHFEDITESSGTTGEGRWSSGASVVDINADGWLDIYVSATVDNPGEKRANLCYINQGLNEKGIPHFIESATAMGIADTGHSVHAAFLDYDLDGDLDLYVLTNQMEKERQPQKYRPRRTDGSNPNTDRLYRNNGNNTFTNVSQEAGITIEGYGLGVAVTDINLDGWPDIYVSNDYLSNDLLWINNQNGTFTNRVSEYLPHQCSSAMGNDVADVNNDGWVDIVALDMLPETNERKKRMVPGNNYTVYMNDETYGYQHQFVRNMLQLNHGMTPLGHPTFGDIGQMAGVHQTDWSWTPMLLDFDHDGLRDLVVTNGYPRDITDHDFGFYFASAARIVMTDSQMINTIPQVKVSNYAFQNQGDLTFKDVSAAWGLTTPSFSNGAAYADFDRDGDMDMVVNNIDDPAFVYRNWQREKDKNHERHYLRLRFQGEGANLQGLGARVQLYYEGKTQVYEHSPYRGYISTVEAVGHFGLGGVTRIDSLRVIWPGGKSQLLRDLGTDRELWLNIKEATEKGPALYTKPANAPLFQEVSQAKGLIFKHSEQDKIDFNIQRTLPHKFSQQGPALAAGDFDGDGLDDLLIGGAAGMAPALFYQKPDGSFRPAAASPLTRAKSEEDAGLLLFDADNDGDNDLYCVSGSYEFAPEDTNHRDRFFRNEKGQFREDSLALPDERVVGSCVRAADYDRDGDLDLFVGGRVISGEYPLPVKSMILQNEGGTFRDVSEQVFPGLKQLGLIHDALWTDFDGDGLTDLLLAGEWMPLTFLRNRSGSFEDVSAQTGIADRRGWWRSLAAADVDRDGDMDYVAGNLGLNTRYCATTERPLWITAKDFDNNGSIDPVIGCYIRSASGEYGLYPIHQREDLIKQWLPVKRRYNTFAEYSTATYEQLIPEKDREGALTLSATYMESSYIENLGGGKFAIRPLPHLAQLSPLQGMQAGDFTGDGLTDLLLLGNTYDTEVFTGKYDAFAGLLLSGDGKGNFTPISIDQSGFFVPHDARALVRLVTAQGQALYIASQNRDSLRVFASPLPAQTFKAQASDAVALMTFADGARQRMELSYGDSYLGQSSRTYLLPPGVVSVEVIDYQGKKRVVSVPINGKAPL
ncbi:MAG: RNA-binding protein [Bacteroidetes bacterium]|nr:MAG: RNA-binding protein [Bacteroidota bacterium]